MHRFLSAPVLACFAFVAACSDESTAPAQGSATAVLFVGSDFKQAELVVYDAKGHAVQGRTALPEADAVPYGSGGSGFVLLRSSGRVAVLEHDALSAIRGTFDLNDDGETAKANPRALLVPAGATAIAVRYGKNTLLELDLLTGAKKGVIDLSAQVAEGDPDGLVDAQDALYDASSQRLYVLLQRIDQMDFSGEAPDYVGACLPAKAVIVVYDLSQRSVERVIELKSANPAALVATDGPEILVLGVGCVSKDASKVRTSRGVEIVNPATGSTSWVVSTQEPERPNGLSFSSRSRVYLTLGSDTYGLNLDAPGTLGDKVANFPKAAVHLGAGEFVGLAVGEAKGGGTPAWSVVSWKDGVVTTRAPSPFGAVSPDPFFGVAGAVVRR